MYPFQLYLKYQTQQRPFVKSTGTEAVDMRVPCTRVEYLFFPFVLVELRHSRTRMRTWTWNKKEGSRKVLFVQIWGTISCSLRGTEQSLQRQRKYSNYPKKKKTSWLSPPQPCAIDNRLWLATLSHNSTALRCDWLGCEGNQVA